MRRLFFPYCTATLCLLLTLCAFGMYQMAGTTVAADGTLKEPFALVLVGLLAAFIGCIALLFESGYRTVRDGLARDKRVFVGAIVLVHVIGAIVLYRWIALRSESRAANVESYALR